MAQELKLVFKFVIVMVSIMLIVAPKPTKTLKNQENEFSRSKPFQISKPRLGKGREDHRLGQEYIEQYQEMMKASQESFENFDERDERRLRRVVSDDDFELNAEASEAPLRRRSASKLQSAVGVRRARSQALRRHKLNNQGFRSHMLHSKRTNLEYSDD